MTDATEARNSTKPVVVHRCRFMNWSPSSITAIALPPLAAPHHNPKPTASSGTFGVLGIGRADGSIELCEWTGLGNTSSHQSWAVQRVLAGPIPSKVENLVFALRDPTNHLPGSVPLIYDLRVFSTTGGKDLLEWDIHTGTVKSLTDSGGGSIWSIALNPASTTLALGCEDGTIRLFSLEDNGITPLRRLDRAKARILSLAWGVPSEIQRPVRGESVDVSDDDDDDEPRWKDNVIYGGCSDSTLRKWDLKTGRVIERMTTDTVRGEHTLVWATGVLPDGTIVTGDSLGVLRFWDGLTHTQRFSFTEHGADVLCLTIGSDGKSVYASGVDQKISEYSLINVNNNTSTRWIHSRTRRVHSHDVRALAIWPPVQLFPPSTLKVSAHSRFHNASQSFAPILLSGGLDFALVVTAIQPPSSKTRFGNPFGSGNAYPFEDSYYRKISFGRLTAGTGGGRATQLARGARYVLGRTEDGVRLWALRKPHALLESEGEDEDEDERLGLGVDADGNPRVPKGEDKGEWDDVLDMKLNLATSLVASAVSDDGSWLAVSDAYETKLFFLSKVSKHNTDATELRPIRVKSLTDVLLQHLPSSVSAPLPSTASSALYFTPDSSRLVLAVASLIVILDLHTPSEAEGGRPAPHVTVVRYFAHHRMKVTVSSVGRVVKPLKGEAVPEATTTDNDETDEMDIDIIEEDDASRVARLMDEPSSWPFVSQLSVSPDGQWLASSDLRGRTHVFNVDTMQYHCVLPTSPLPPTSLTFDPSAPHQLLLTFPNNVIQLFDVETREYPAFVKHVLNDVRQSLFSMNDALAGATFDPQPTSGPKGTRRRDVILWGSTFLVRINLNEPLPSRSQSNKRKMWEKTTDAHGAERHKLNVAGLTYQATSRYKDVLFVEFVGPNELVVVERPLVELLQTQPPAYFKTRYGRG